MLPVFVMMGLHFSFSSWHNLWVSKERAWREIARLSRKKDFLSLAGPCGCEQGWGKVPVSGRFTIWSFSMVNCIRRYLRCFRCFSTKHKRSYLLFLDFFFLHKQVLDFAEGLLFICWSNHVSCLLWTPEATKSFLIMHLSAVLKGDVSIVMQGNIQTSRRYRSYFDATSTFMTQIWLTPSQLENWGVDA